MEKRRVWAAAALLAVASLAVLTVLYGTGSVLEMDSAGEMESRKGPDGDGRQEMMGNGAGGEEGEGRQNAGSTAEEPVHRCIHDDVVAKRMLGAPVYVHENKHMSTQEWEEWRSSKAGMEARANKRAPEPIRIRFDTSLLDNDPNRTCTTAGQNYKIGSPAGPGLSPTCGGSTTSDCWGVCTADDVLTPAKRTQFLNTTLSDATTWLSGALRVERVPGTHLTLANGNCGSPGSFAIPSSRVSPGTTDADLLIFLTARPAVGSTVAYASDCNQFDTHGRPVVGHFNINPNRVVVSPTALVRHQQKAVAIHEITHILGFVNGRYNNFRDGSGNLIPQSSVVVSSTHNSHTVYKIISSNARAWARTHIDCATLDGVQLEDQGGAGTANSHWEQRLYYNDYMSGSIFSNPVLSGLTLSLLQDMGFYYPDFTYEGIQTLAWGRKQGCDWATQRCDSTSSWSTALGYRCTLADSGVQGCSVDRESKATCSIVTYPPSTIPSYFQYFANAQLGGGQQFADFCPHQTAYASGNCREPTNRNSQSYLYGEDFCAHCRCYSSSLLDVRAVFSTSARPRCHEERCLASDELQVGVNGVWYTCPQAGGALSVFGFTGSVTCPTAAQACGDFAIPASVSPTLPAVTSVFPAKGPSNGLEVVTLAGVRFHTGMSVDIGGVPCTNLNVESSTQATCITGAKTGLTTATNVDVVVTHNAALNYQTVRRNAYQYDPTFPTFTRIFPTGGPTAGGTPVTLFGTAFSEVGSTYVTLAGLQCSNTTVLDSTRIRCFTPDTNTTAITNGDLVITDATGRILQSNGAYTFDNAWPRITAVSPAVGPPQGRGVVTLTGVGLRGDGPVTAQVGDFACTNPQWLPGGSQVRCNTPPAVNLASLTHTHAYVEDASGRAAAGPFVYTYDPAWVDFDNLQPPTGPSLPQTYWTVTLTGRNFATGPEAANVSVWVGGQACRNTQVLSSTQLTCLPAPVNITSPLATDVRYTDANRSVEYTRAEMFLYDHEWPVVDRIFPTGGSVAGEQYIELSGSNFITTRVPSINVDGRACLSPTVISSTLVSCVTPARSSALNSDAQVDVTLLDPAGRLAVANNAFRYQATWPQFVSISPASVVNQETATITITGTNFTFFINNNAATAASIKVLLGDTEATSVNATSDTTVVATVAPKLAALSADAKVDVTIVDSQDRAVKVPGGFTISVPPTPPPPVEPLLIFFAAVPVAMAVLFVFLNRVFGVLRGEEKIPVIVMVRQSTRS